MQVLSALETDRTSESLSVFRKSSGRTEIAEGTSSEQGGTHCRIE